MVQKVAAFDIGDLLYFAVLIVGAVYSWIKKTNESKNKQGAPQKSVIAKEKTEQNPIDDFLKEILNQPTKRKAPIEEEKHKKAKTKKPVYNFQDDNFDRVKYSESIQTPAKKIVAETQPINQVNFYNGEQKNNLNLRDMIVLDAIFNRPYK